MTAAFDAHQAAQSGALEFRFVIEGCDTVWCTTELMAGTQSDGRTRAPGLRREGLGFSERVYIAGAEHDTQIDSVVVEEAAGQWLGLATRVFTQIAERVCSITATLATTGVAKVAAGNGSLFTVNSRYHLGTECVKVTAIDTTPVDPLPDELTLARGEWDTTAQEHPVTVGEHAQVSDVYDIPTGWAQRRCWLYAHTPSELGVADAGTVVWRGTLAREPILSDDDTLSWSFSVEPRTKALDASIAGGFDQGFGLRGIYYPGTDPLVVVVRRGTTAAQGSAAGTAVQVILSGFWETQEAFCSALTSALNANATIVSWAISFEARAWGDATWDLIVTTDSTPLYIEVTGGSAVDGVFHGLLQADPITAPGDDDGITGGAVFTVVASTAYRCKRDPSREALVPFADQRRVPRTQNGLSSPVRDTDANIATYPGTRLYLTRIGALTSGDDIVISPASVDERGAPYGDDAPAQVLRIASVSASTNSVVSSEGGDASSPPRIAKSGNAGPMVTGAARYASGDGSLAAFRDDLLSRAPTVANRGRGPWVTSDDIASWTSAVAEAAAGRAWLLHRLYTFAKPVKAIDVITEEMKLAGLIPYLDADAKLAVRQFTLGGNAAATIDVDGDNHLVDDNLGSVTGEADGLVTVVHLLTGYDAAEDKHTGGDVRYRGLSAVARVHAERVLEIAPRSRAVAEEPDWLDLSERGMQTIALFGDRRTHVVKIDVGLECFDVLVGDTVNLTIPSLPSDGYRTDWTPGSGMIDRRGILIGRSWDLAAGAGTFEILLHELELAGYTPSAKVDSAAGAGTGWTLTCTQNHYAPTGTNDLSLFTSGMAIRLIEWDAAAPTIREGTVNGTPTATTIAVTLATAWAGFGGASRYLLTFDTSDDAETTAAQLAYCYQAGASGRIPLSGGSTRTPRELAP